MVLPVRPQDASGVYQRQVAQAQAVAAHEATRRTARGGGAGRRLDEVALSPGALSFARVMEAVQQRPEVRADRVADVRTQIAAGTYSIDARVVAERLVDGGFGKVGS